LGDTPKVIKRGLSVVMPVFNEERTVEQIIRLVLRQELTKQLIVVDDCSTDRSWQIIVGLQNELGFLAIRHELNKGKGACLRSASPLISEQVMIIQDADLEYHPDCYERLIRPVLDGKADVVYGSRFQTGDERRILYFWHYVGNKFLTLLSNMITNINLSDMETCYKLMKSELYRNLDLQEKRFGVEPEITCKLARAKVRFYEVSISYHGRTYDEGKKIHARDGFRAIYCLIRYGLFSHKISNETSDGQNIRNGANGL
jgi:glycosyltransferase involved in cell wall biosynthesis